MLVTLQAGTLSGNPLAMTAGIVQLQILERPGTYEYLDKITGRLINGLLDAARDAGHEVCGGHISGKTQGFLMPYWAHLEPDQVRGTAGSSAL